MILNLPVSFINLKPGLSGTKEAVAKEEETKIEERAKIEEVASINKKPLFYGINHPDRKTL